MRNIRAALACAGWLAAGAVQAADPPPVVYWMDVATESGMGSGGSLAGVLGAMMGGGSPLAQSARTLSLWLNSPQPLPREPRADHLIPPGQQMGESLPLRIEAPGRAAGGQTGEDVEEKPRGRLLLYWGCGAEVRAGQPRVIDFARLGPEEAARAMSGIRAATGQVPPRPRQGWIYALWPNRDHARNVPANASLQGSHALRSNYTPDNIRFGIGARHDFMPPVSLSVLGFELGKAIPFRWRSVDNATAYFATATGGGKGDEVVIWTSSESAPAWGLPEYLPPAEVRRLLQDKTLMPPAAGDCTVPAGIFARSEGAMLRFVAYGDELNVAYPPRPDDPKKPWNPIWTVKVRVKSAAGTVLGMEMDTSQGSARPGAEEKPQAAPTPMDAVPDAVKALKGIFGR